MVRQAAPPSGHMPPTEVRLRAGTTVAIAGLAAEATERHLARHPGEVARFGQYTAEWCRHDLQWVLSWAVQDADGQPVDLLEQLDWLARVLTARDYPAASLADALDELAAVSESALPAAGTLLRAGAERARQAA